MSSGTPSHETKLLPKQSYPANFSGTELHQCSRTKNSSSTSLILNIAEGNGRYAELDQAKFLDIAESAAVKLAAYLDLSVEKSAMTAKDSVSGKTLLVRIEAMLQSM